VVDAAQRHESAQFLRSRRACRSPEDAALAVYGRRRVPGLRREEVATLAGVSATWYTWLEQARDIHVSEQILDALAGALGLDPAERAAHLYLLAGQPAPIDRRQNCAPIGVGLQTLLDTLEPNPAHVLTPYWDVLAWNRAAAALFVDFAQFPKQHRNLLWLLFTQPGMRSLFVDWDGEVARLLRVFRGAAGPHLVDPRAREIFAQLGDASDEFRRLWERQDVAAFVPADREYQHPLVGRLALYFVKLETSEADTNSLVVHLPVDRHNQAKLRELAQMQ
jgi:transcriptional regulator with XRE-family HTH domain